LLKKIYSILFLFMLLFNWVGFRLLNYILEDRANKQLETALDNNDYDKSDLVSIKIPVSYLPYYNNSSSFERVDGRVEIQGIEYRYVKRRIFNDSLELLCIPNHAVMKMRAVKDEFLRFLNDLHSSTGTGKSTNNHHGSTKIFAIEYYAAINPFGVNDLHSIISPVISHYFITSTSSHYLIVEQPPENV
jgi:hypothetical protein